MIAVSNTTQEGVIDMDKNRLMYEMSKKNVSIGDMCVNLGISRSAFYRKCNGVSEFTQSEIQGIVDLLELKSPMGIFFREKVSEMTPQ